MTHNDTKVKAYKHDVEKKLIRSARVQIPPDVPADLYQEFLQGLCTGKVGPRYLNGATSVKQDEDSLRWACACWWWRRRSEQEAQRLGYQLTSAYPLWSMGALIEEAHWQRPEEPYKDFTARMQKLGEKYGLFQEHIWYQPNYMEAELDSRRDGDALIKLVADDRGDMEHMIIVEWLPEWAEYENPKFEREAYVTQ